MRHLLLGFLMGLILASVTGTAQEAPIVSAPLFNAPLIVPGFVGTPLGAFGTAPSYPPSMQSLPPMPVPHWQRPC